MRIHQLPPAIANQIAAGEVIERPASVVKELLENSLDAGADLINIEINYGGLNQIKISDNGFGIVAEDLPLAISAHATSKISTLNDLYAINSMGFRGEALASIASVAKVTISSKPEQQEHAMMLYTKGDEYKIMPCARTTGTTIDVSDLFFNAPVRKRFLKSERLEFQAIELVIKRFALSAPHIALTLTHNNKPVLSLPSALDERGEQRRMLKILGSNFIQDAVFLDVEQGAMKLRGWVSGPGFQRSQSDRQWVYINQRMVKDKLINHALKQAYDGLLHPGRFPTCLLYFSIANAEVDVNVHPTKHEVRFQQPRLVHDFLMTHLVRALSTVSDQKEYGVDEEQNSNHICEPYPALVRSERRQGGFPRVKEDRVNLRTSNNPQPLLMQEEAWIGLNKQYSLFFIDHQPHLVDVVYLYQQWLKNQILGAGFPLEGRPLLVPMSCSIPDKFKNNEDQLSHYLSQLGIRVELTKDHCILIRSIPINSPYLDVRLLLEHIAQLDSFTENDLVGAVGQSQSFDAEFLGEDERVALSKFLIQQQTKPMEQTAAGLVSKQLTIEDCRVLLDV